MWRKGSGKGAVGRRYRERESVCVSDFWSAVLSSLSLSSCARSLCLYLPHLSPTPLSLLILSYHRKAENFNFRLSHTASPLSPHPFPTSMIVRRCSECLREDSQYLRFCGYSRECLVGLNDQVSCTRHTENATPALARGPIDVAVALIALAAACKTH